MSIYYMRKEQNPPKGAIAFYVDDMLAPGNGTYKKVAEQIPKRSNLYEDHLPLLIFASINITKPERGYFMEEEYFTENLKALQKDAKVPYFIHMRHILPWITHTTL